VDASALGKLLSPDGWALLGTLPPYDESRTMAISERLRAGGFDPELVAAALTQSRLRARARAKFADFADGMLFTEAGLEQATRFTVAARHAQRFAAAGIDAVADLTTGIGGDSMAMAALGLRVLGFELDELTAAIATVNLRHFPDAEVRYGDGLGIDLLAEGIGGVFADPSRRTRGGTRLFDPNSYAPPLADLLALRATLPALGIKVGPGIAHSDLPPDAEAQWISVDGDVVEAGLWFGPLAPEGPGRTALVIRAGTAVSVRRAARPEPVPIGSPGAYLYEPDGAVIRSGLVEVVASEVSGRLLDRTIAYVTSDALVPTALATGYRVQDVMPFGLKRLRTYLREHDVGRLTIKKRGTAVVPEQLRRQLDLSGSQESTVVLTRVAGAQMMLIVSPLGTSHPD